MKNTRTGHSRTTLMMIEPGQIEAICGCMFSGKTSALLERIARFRAAGEPVYTFKHDSDTRYEQNSISAHTGKRAEAAAIAGAEQIEALVKHPGLIAIDEGQFFTKTLAEMCREMASRGHAVVIAGLDLDSWGLPFDAMSEVMALADHMTRLKARCGACGRPAERTQRLAPITGGPMVAGPVAYEPRCVECFVAPPIALRR